MLIRNLFLIVTACFALPAASAELRNTPLGPFPVECILEHKSGTKIEEIDGGVQAISPDGTTKVYPYNQVCIDFSNDWRRKNSASQPAPSSANADKDTPYTNGTTVSYTSPEQVTSFSSNYSVPANPIVENDDQFIYYWIGLQDPEAKNTVLQPVLGYVGYSQQWQAQGVHCCHGGFQQQAAPITGMQPGDTVTGTITWNGSDYFTITATWNNQSSALKTTTTPGADFDWAILALEPYAHNCNEIPAGPMIFSDIRIQSGTGPITPIWGPGEVGSCSIVTTNTSSEVIITSSNE